jgi:hypothetical protein
MLGCSPDRGEDSMKSRAQTKPLAQPHASSPSISSTSATSQERGTIRELVALPTLAALHAVRLDTEKREATLRVDGPASASEVAARLDSALDPAVVETAIARGERLIVQREGGAFVVLGALRTAATPGLERGQDYTIEASRIFLRADNEMKLVSGSVQIALRAIGQVETIARDITARASAVHKLIGRMLHLN